MERPVFKPCFRVEPVAGEAIYLLSELGHFALRGRLYALLAPLLDGRRTVAEIVSLLAGHAGPADVLYALDVLAGRGYLAERPDAGPVPEAAFWNLHGLGGASAAQRLGEASVALVEVGGAAAEACAPLLARLGIRTAAEDRAELVLVAADDYLQPELEAINARRLADGRPWVLVKPLGTVPWIGPIFQPGQTACWSCLAQRLRANREVQSYLQERTGSTRPLITSIAGIPSTVETALGFAVTELARFLATGEHRLLQHHVVTLDLWSLQIQRHALVRRPQCTACGDGRWSPDREPEPVVLASCKKVFTDDGGHRATTPETTLERYGGHVSPITGAVSSLERTSPASGNGLLNVYFAGHNSAQRYDSLYFLRQGLRSKSGGKGMTDLQARASALCEGLERYSGVFQGEEIRCRATQRELGSLAIPPNDCMLFSARQMAERQAWNSRLSRFQIVPMPLDPDDGIEWTPVYSLSRREFRYLPTGYCYYGYPVDPARFYCWADSNGNASGNTLEEAILQGFLELVERDAVSLWWYNRLRRPAVDLDSFDEPYLQRVREHYASLGRDLWALDLTSDLGIPVFVVLSARTDGSREDIIMGFGAHLDPRIALLRAATESNQFVPAVLGREAGQDRYAYDDPDALWWWRNATRDNQPYLLPAPDTGPSRAADFPRRWSDDLLDDLELCRGLVEERGMEMLVLDQTRPDVGMPVAKVFVPGLRHFWARFALGRLFEVPVEMGWLDRPLTEEELNPIPMFL